MRSARVFTRSGKAGSKYTQSAARITSYLRGMDGGSGSPLVRDKKKSRKDIMMMITPTPTRPRKGKKREAPVQFSHRHG